MEDGKVMNIICKNTPHLLLRKIAHDDRTLFYEMPALGT